MDSLSGTLARWICDLDLADIPAAVVDDARLHLTDTLGVMVAGSVSETGRAVRAAALRIGPGDAARILGFGDRAAAAGAAIANGTLAHVHDYDDTHSEARIHISAPVVTAALAAGQTARANGRTVLTAIIAGSELTARLGAMTPGAFHNHGYHPTGVLGTIGAAFTASKVMGLAPPQMQNAIGIAASQAAGIAESFSDGTWTKRLHAGWAAHCGVAAATLADSGFTGPVKALDGARGLFNAHLGKADHPYARVTEGLGTQWLCTGSSCKPYPCGHLIHAYIEGVYGLREEALLNAREVKTITCPVAPWVMPMVCEPRADKVAPTTEAQAKISLYYCIAAAMLLNRIDLAAFTPQAIADPRIAELAQKIVCTPDPDAPEDQTKGWLIVHTVDGRKLETVLTHPLGSPRNPMTADDVARKFTDNMAFANLKDNAAQVQDLVARIEALPSIDTLVGACCP